MAKPSVTPHIQRWLGAQAPLTRVSLSEAYATFPELPRDNVRSAYQHAIIGSKVAEQHHRSIGARSDERKYFGVRVPTGGRPGHLDLSLPGISRRRIRDDTERRAEAIMSAICAVYGNEVATYWLGSAQHRSVTVAAKGMKLASDRDRHCRLCSVLHAAGLGPPPADAISSSAQHLVSRKATFWRAVEAVEAKHPGALFSQIATAELRERLRTDPYHNDPSMIVRLCAAHDRRLQNLLGRASVGRGPLATAR